MIVNYRVLSFDKSLHSIVVNYFTETCPQGLTYSLDLPVELGLDRESLKSFILTHAPKGQLERMHRIQTSAIDTSTIDAMVQASFVSREDAATEQLRAAKMIHFEQKLDQFLAKGVVYRGYRFDSRLESLGILSSVLVAIQSGQALDAGFTWRNSINVDIPFNERQVAELHGLMINHVQNGFRLLWDKKEAARTLPSLAELEKLDWKVLGDLV